MGYENNYLMHHGIKGMHWGVRRFRNYDGTLTSAGKAQRRAQSSGGSSRRGMSSTTKKRLATAAKVAGAAAAVGGAAYLANRASGGQLARDAKFNARYAREVGRDAIDRVADTKAGLAVRRTASNLRDKASNSKLANRARVAKAHAQYAIDSNTKITGAKRRAGEALSNVRDRAANARDRVSSVASNARDRVSSAASNTRDRVSSAVSNSKLANRARVAKAHAQYAIDSNTRITGAKRRAGEALSNARDRMANARDRVSSAASNARDRISSAPSNVRDKVANRARVAKAHAQYAIDSNTRITGAKRRAGEALSNVRDRAANVRAKASKTFNTLVDRGQQEVDNRAAARNRRNGTTGSLSRAARDLNSTADARISRARTNARNAIRNAPANARSAASNARAAETNAIRNAPANARNAASNARDRVSSAASATRSRAVSGASYLRDRVSSAASNARTRAANSKLVSKASNSKLANRARVAKAHAQYAIDSNTRITGAKRRVGEAASSARSKVSNAGRMARSTAKAGYYRTAGKSKIQEQTRTAKRRANNRRMYGNG